jgi:hypothetical protein
VSLEKAAIGAAVATANSVVALAMMTVVAVIIIVIIIMDIGPVWYVAYEQYAAANRRWVCADGRFNITESTYQTERDQLVARPESKPFGGGQHAGRGGIRSNSYV